MKRYNAPMIDLCVIVGADEVIRTSEMSLDSTGSGRVWDVASAISEQNN